MSLTNRVATVLTTVVPSTDAETLLREVAAAIATAEKNLAQQRTLALDPTSTDDLVSTARKAIGETEFDIERLQEAQKRLQERFDDLTAAEKAARAKADRDELLARQTAIREKFNAEYYIMAQRISALAQEMIAAGLEDELPEIRLGDGSRSERPISGIGFNRRRYWPLPQSPGEQPSRSIDPDISGKVAILTEGSRKGQAA